MKRISWTAHVTNESVLKQTCQVRQLLNTIKIGSCNFLDISPDKRICSKFRLLDVSMENDHGAAKVQLFGSIKNIHNA